MSSAKQPGPDFHMRLGDEKEQWQTAAKSDGFDQLGSWVKWVVRNHLKKKLRAEKKD